MPSTYSNFDLGVKLALKVGLGEGDLEVAGSVDLASAGLSLPSINLVSSELQDGGVLSASASSTFAGLSIQAGALVAGPLASTTNLYIGPFYVSMTPVSLALGPTLSFAQTGTMTPTNELTYSFSEAVDVTKNGADPVHVSSVTFTPGVDTIGIRFPGHKITVTPTWTTALDFHNKVDLVGSLEGTLKLGELTVGGFAKYGFADVTVGPVFEQPFSLGEVPLATLYDGTMYNIAHRTESLPSFEIGSTFKPDLKVSKTYANGESETLRFAVQSANTLGENDSAPQIIHLGPGTYALTTMGSGGASVGDLDITGNVVIEGAGAGRTFINSSDMVDRVFNVHPGASLTLDGVTLSNGYSDEGGAIYNAGTLAVSNSTLHHNYATGDGGGIYNTGGLTITNSTLDANRAETSGGG